MCECVYLFTSAQVMKPCRGFTTSVLFITFINESKKGGEVSKLNESGNIQSMCKNYS